MYICTCFNYFHIFQNVTLNDAQKTKFLEGKPYIYHAKNIAIYNAFFAGEQFLCDAENVMLFRPLSDRKKSVFGVLTITTFKLSFATPSDATNEVNSDFYQQNHLLGPNEICLSSIDALYQMGDRSKKKLTSIVSGKIKELLVVCKNMRTFHFSFKHCEKDKGNKIALALLRHAYPQRHSLLFAYDYK